jgi:hypothetical protein
LNSLVTRLAVLDAGYDDREKTRRDCMTRVQEQRHLRQMKDLNVAIRSAETGGNEAELRRLLEEQHRLIERRKAARGA